jgi:tyrosyl-tRNA synthetase
MPTNDASNDEQMRVLMRGVEFGDSHIHETMQQELRERLAEGRPLRVYAGFDPTSADLTIGNMVPMLKMRQFQDFGHEVTFLFGTMTGIVGDPSDKTAARQMMAPEEIEANARAWLPQVYRVLDEAKTTIRRNGEWLEKLGLADVIELGSNFTVAQFLERQTFAERMERGQPIYIHEFLYALMQAYDALIMKTDVQIGGIDQLFNILAGRTLQRARGERPLTAITMPLLVGTDGHLKMSKSTGNYVGLDEPAAEKFGKLMSIPDGLILNYFMLLTTISNDELAELEEALEKRNVHPMDLKKRLAYEVVTLLDGAEAAQAAREEFERVFQRREEPEQSAQDFRVPFENGRASIDILQLVVDAGFVPSRSEARRLLQQGGLSLDGQRLTSAQVSVRPGALLKVGRHRFLRLVER